MTWKKLSESDCREWKLTTVDPQERSTWRSEGGGGSLMWILPLHLPLNQKSESDYDHDMTLADDTSRQSLQ